MSRPVRATALAGVIALVAACGGTTPSPATASPAPSASPVGSPASSPDASATGSPSPSTDTSASPGTSASPSADAAGGGTGGASASASASADTGGSIGSEQLGALEDEIPGRIGGVTLRTTSFTAADVPDAAIDPALGAGIGAISTDLLNSAVAIGIGTDVSRPLVVTLVHVPGGRAGTLESSFAEAMEAVNRGNVTVRERTVAGQTVTEVNAGSDAIGTVLWAEGETLYVVQSVDAQLRTAAVDALAS